MMQFETWNGLNILIISIRWKAVAISHNQDHSSDEIWNSGSAYKSCSWGVHLLCVLCKCNSSIDIKEHYVLTGSVVSSGKSFRAYGIDEFVGLVFFEICVVGFSYFQRSWNYEFNLISSFLSCNFFLDSYCLYFTGFHHYFSCI